MYGCLCCGCQPDDRPAGEGRSEFPKGQARDGRFISSRRLDHWYLVSGRSFSLAAVLVQPVTHSHSSPSPSRPTYVPPSNITTSPRILIETLIRQQATAHIEVKNRPHRAVYTWRGFINRSNLPFRAYYSPVCKPVSRLNPRRRRRCRPPPLPRLLLLMVGKRQPLLTRDTHPTPLPFLVLKTQAHAIF